MNLTDDQIRSLRERLVAAQDRACLSLVEEVQQLREIVADARIRLDDRATRLDEQSARLDALAAKAEAGKGLYEALLEARAFVEHHPSVTGTWPLLIGLLGRALARWEAVENG